MEGRNGAEGKTNMEKTKSIVTGNKARERIQSERWSCRCCGRGVGANFVFSMECNKRVNNDVQVYEICEGYLTLCVQGVRKIRKKVMMEV